MTYPHFFFSLCPSLTRLLMRTEGGTDGDTILSRHQILPWSCTWCKKHPHVEKQIVLLQSVSVRSVTFLYQKPPQQQKKIPMYFLTGIFMKFLPKCCFEIREEYLLYDLLWPFKIYTSFPVCHSTLLSFLALTEAFWVHFL